jgi:hypothetical protein
LPASFAASWRDLKFPFLNRIASLHPSGRIHPLPHRQQLCGFFLFCNFRIALLELSAVDPPTLLIHRVARRAKNVALQGDRAGHLDVNSAYPINKSELVWNAFGLFIPHPLFKSRRVGL